MMKMRFLFQTLIYCIIFISHCDYGKSLADKETSTPPIVVNSVELENEMAPFNELYNKLEETKCEKEKQFIKGRFFGRLEKELEEKIKKIKEVNQLLEDRGSLKQHKERSDLYRVLLGIGHRIDTLEGLLTAGTNVKLLNRPRDARWLDILNLETPIVKEFRKRVYEAGMDRHLFAKCVQNICQERNERAGHADASLPDVLKESSLKEVVRKLKIIEDDTCKHTIKILIAPLKLPTTTTNSSSSTTNSSPSTTNLPPTIKPITKQ